MGEQGPVDLVDRGGRHARRNRSGQPHHDARSAEAALTASRRKQGVRPTLPDVTGQAFESGDLSTLHPPDGSHACDPRRAVDPHGAAPALTLRTAAVLDRTNTAPVTQGVEERATVVGHLDVRAVDAKPDQGSELDQAADGVSSRRIS
jgi:hypothetical protein